MILWHYNKKTNRLDYFILVGLWREKKVNNRGTTNDWCFLKENIGLTGLQCYRNELPNCGVSSTAPQEHYKSGNYLLQASMKPMICTEQTSDAL